MHFPRVVFLCSLAPVVPGSAAAKIFHSGAEVVRGAQQSVEENHSSEVSARLGHTLGNEALGESIGPGCHSLREGTWSLAGPRNFSQNAKRFALSNIALKFLHPESLQASVPRLEQA